MCEKCENENISRKPKQMNLFMLVDEGYRNSDWMDYDMVLYDYEMIKEMGMEDFVGSEEECVYAMNLIEELHNVKYSIYLEDDRDHPMPVPEKWILA